MKGEHSIVPKTYDEVQRYYGKYIHTLLTRHNKVDYNLQDLHGHIWVKILEARILERFQDYVKLQIPKVITAFQATELLGISWRQWVSAMKDFHISGKRWMPTPINQAQLDIEGVKSWEAKNALFSLFDVLQLTFGRKAPFSPMGHHVEGGEVVGGERPEGYLKFPELNVTPSLFKNYLTMAVLNHFANFCRTLDRRHKERPQHNQSGQENLSWEATIEDANQASPEVAAASAEVCAVLSEAMQGDPAHEVVISRLKDGVSLSAALKGDDITPGMRKSVMKALGRLRDRHH